MSIGLERGELMKGFRDNSLSHPCFNAYIALRSAFGISILAVLAAFAVVSEEVANFGREVEMLCA
jgi:hypothetical protein